ncbi:DUF421 domain-containing protein [Bacillus solimangrovi]|uniref:DUF421 domain-containing protein n=1 Tax=Bacillus solimangrovi TaxID=1305675 RepID=A0A1E5LBX8_9BACI|nr:DUF421 domain-containing protein [Bacillus solimangrovi]OEH91587.1 hypothetical protein BFG57_04225 [Bacillus solimangrovi]
MTYGQTAIELVIGFIALFFTTKILGKSQITQITTFDFISALVLGELVGNALYDDDVRIYRVLFAVSLWTSLILLLEVITQKFKRTRHFLEGQPSIIIRKGEIHKESLKKNKLDVNQLQHLLRTKDVFSLREVEYALLETDGSISILKRSGYATPTRNDFNLPEEKVVLPVTIIIDGEVILDNLQSIGFDEAWLKSQLRSHGAANFSDVMYAEWKEGESIYIEKY